MSKTATPAADKTPGEIAFDTVVATIKRLGMAETGACVAAGLDESALRSARKTGSLGLPGVAAFAKLFKMPIGALLGEAPAPKAAKEDASVRRIPLLDLAQSPLNPRKAFDAVELRELADSIAALGLLQNLVVRPMRSLGYGNGKTTRVSDGAQLYEVVAGERRFRALEILRTESRLPADLADQGIPCKIVDATDGDHIVLAILENMQRRDVNPMDEAEAIARLQAIDPVKYSCPELGRLTGKTERHYQLRLQLVKNLLPEAKTALREGKITLANARVLTIAPAKKQKDYLKSGAAANYKADDLKRQVTNQWRLCSYARFDYTAQEFAAYIVKDGDSEWFTDAGKFDELQLQWADAMAEEAKTRFKWVERVTHLYEGDYKPDRASPVTKGGCVIVVSHGGFVHVHEGMVRKERQGDGKSAADIRRDKIDFELREERIGAAATFVDAVRRAVTPREALMLMLFEMLSTYGAEFSRPLEGGPCMMPDIFKGPLKRLAGSVAVQPHQPSAGLKIKEKADIRLCWEWLDCSSDAEIAEAVTMSIVPAIRINHHWPVHPAFLAIAKKHQIDVPPVLLLARAALDAEIDRRAALPDAQRDLEDAIAEQGEAA